MINEILRKWFGLDPIVCSTCEILRTQLENSENERRDLLNRLLDRNKPEVRIEPTEELKPITPQFIPWRVRQQMLEAEDHKKAQLMKEREKEISELEKELDINHDVSGPSGGVQVK